MPAANKYSISEIIKSAEDYYKKTGRFIWLNYMLFLGFNNLNEDVKKLANLLKDKKEIFKLILTEPNNDIDNYQKAGYGDLLEFEDKLRNNGVENEIVRFMTAGKDVGAGCGEFVFIPKK